MDYHNDERYWNINLLNKWFAISSIVFLGSMVWLFIDDNDDDYKTYQKEFRKLSIDISEKKLEEAESKIEEQKDKYLNKLESAKADYNLKNTLLDTALSKKEILRGKFYKANMDYLSFKAEVDEIRYLFETEKLYLEEDPVNYQYKYKDQYNTALDKLLSMKLDKEDLETKQITLDDYIKDLRSNLKNVEDEVNKFLREVNLIQNKLKSLDRDRMTTANKIGDFVRDLPIIDFLAPYYKVNQIVVNDIKYDVNFAQVATVDRCTSCHLGIDDPDYKDAPQPYTSHPKLDIFLSSSSPHPKEEYGCTGCHAGRARGMDFVSSTHTPNNKEDKERWKEDYDWHKMHHWLKPMLPTRYSEAGCVKCHTKKIDIPGAEKVSLGFALIEKSGCNACHAIETIPKTYNPGPDLTKIHQKVDKNWTRNWIHNPQSFRFNTWMPHYFNQDNNSSPEMIKRNKAEVYAMTEYLFSGNKNKRNNDSKYIGDKESGEKLFNAVGCLGCHVIETEKVVLTQDDKKLPYERLLASYGYEENEMTSYELLKNQGPNLIGLGSKTDAEWLYKWIKNPRLYWPETRMPNLRLTDQEAKDITAYLLSFKNEEFESIDDIEFDKEETKNIAFRWLRKVYTEEEAQSRVEEMNTQDQLQYVGMKSINNYGCYTCHNIGGFENAKPIGAELTHQGSKPLGKLDFGHIHNIDHSTWGWHEQKIANPRIFDRGKIVEPEDASRMPNFYFKPEEVEAIVTAISGLTTDKVSPSKLSETYVQDPAIFEGHRHIRQLNCKGCHVIENQGGQIVDITGLEYGPPNLNTEGSKVQPDWLFKFFKNPMTIRPSLQVRMPSFHQDDEEWNSIIKAFQHIDDQYLSYESDFIVDKNSTKYKAGDKLHELGACNNCHFYGVEFPKQAAGTWAPNLALTKSRLRPEWLVDWLDNPQIIMPGTKMPAPYIPTLDILEVDGAENIWGSALVDLKGDRQAMLMGLRDYVYAINGKQDITDEIKKYFEKNGYDFNEEDDEEDWDDEDW